MAPTGPRLPGWRVVAALGTRALRGRTRVVCLLLLRLFEASRQGSGELRARLANMLFQVLVCKDPPVRVDTKWWAAKSLQSPVCCPFAAGTRAPLVACMAVQVHLLREARVAPRGQSWEQATAVRVHLCRS